MSQICSTPTLLFINKNPKSEVLSRSEGKLASSINRQAQRWAKKKSRKEKAESIQAASVRVRKVAQLEWSKNSADEDEEPATSTERNQSIISDSTSASDCQLYSANVSEGDAIDPFNATVIRIDSKIHKILQYYLEYSILQSFRGEIPTRGHVLSYDARSPYSAVVRGCLRNEMHMYALLTATTAHLNKMSSNPSSKLPNTYMQPAIQSLRVYLQARTDQTTIDRQLVLDVLYLAVAEWFGGDYTATMTHMRALTQLTKLLDKSDCLSQYIYEMVSLIDIYISAETGSQPLLPLPHVFGAYSKEKSALMNRELDEALLAPLKRSSRRDEKAVTSRNCLSVILKPWIDWPWRTEKAGIPRSDDLPTGITERMGLGFNEVLGTKLFSPEMHAIVTDLVHSTQVTLYAQICPSATQDDVVWATRKSYTLLHRLVSFRPVQTSFDISPITPPDSSRKEECIRLALIILISHLSSPTEHRSTRINTQRLQIALTGIDTTWGSKLEDEMLLWVLGAPLLLELDESTEEYFMDQAALVARNLGIHDYTGVQKMLWRYLHFRKPRSLQHPSVCRFASKLRPEKNRQPPPPDILPVWI